MHNAEQPASLIASYINSQLSPVCYLHCSAWIVLLNVGSLSQDESGCPEEAHSLTSGSEAVDSGESTQLTVGYHATNTISCDRYRTAI